MKTQTLLIGGLAVGVLAYMWHKKAQTAGAQTAEGVSKLLAEETKPLNDASEGKGIVPPPMTKKPLILNKKSTELKTPSKGSVVRSTSRNAVVQGKPNSELRSQISPKIDSETETFAFNINF